MPAKKAMQKSEAVCCHECGQTITSEVALAKERLRQQKQEEEDAIEKAAETTIRLFKNACKQVKKPFKLEVEEWCEGGSLKEPVEYIEFNLTIGGLYLDDQLSLSEAVKVLKALGVDIKL